MFGKGMVSSGEMNAHKKMAGADKGGNFGVKGLPQRDKQHPDAGMSHAPLEEAKRGAPAGLGGGTMAKQAAPAHGPQYDHFKRDGKA